MTAALFARLVEQGRARWAMPLAEAFPDLTIMLMTGYAEQKRRAHNLDVLIHDIISKPFTIEELAEAVEQTLTAE